MALRANATMRFVSYEVGDTGITMTFHCPDPGPGMDTEWDIFVTDAELSAVTTQQELGTLVTNKLNRKLRRAGTATRLDPFIGQEVVI